MKKELGDIQNQGKRAGRRRKKKRTEDFSSSEESSSEESSNEEEEDVIMGEVKDAKEEHTVKEDNKSISLNNVLEEEELITNKEIKKKLLNLQIENSNNNINKISLENIKTNNSKLDEFVKNNLITLQDNSVTNSGKSEIDNKEIEPINEEFLDDYLNLIMKDYEIDLDLLREKAHDLNKFSLNMLANTLRNGGDLFSSNELKNLLGK